MAMANETIANKQAKKTASKNLGFALSTPGRKKYFQRILVPNIILIASFIHLYYWNKPFPLHG
jgi:hypothetical protein